MKTHITLTCGQTGETQSEVLCANCLAKLEPIPADWRLEKADDDATCTGCGGTPRPPTTSATPLQDAYRAACERVEALREMLESAETKSAEDGIGDEFDEALDARDDARQAWHDSNERRSYDLWQEGGGCESFEADGLDAAITKAKRSLADGCWDGTDEAFIAHAEITCDDGTDMRISVAVNTEAPEPTCAGDLEHSWESPVEVVGGCRDNPGTFALGGTQITSRSVCEHCGTYRVYRSESTRGQCPEEPESTRYEDADETSLTWLARQLSGSLQPDDLTDLEPVATYVATFPDGDGEGACDVTVSVGRFGNVWAVVTSDDAGGATEVQDEVWPSHDAAVEAAEDLAVGQDESDGDEDAAGYLARLLAERAAATDADGPYAVYGSTALDDSGPRPERYSDLEAARAAAALANDALRQAHPGGNLLCGYDVRTRIDGEWVPVDEES